MNIDPGVIIALAAFTVSIGGQAFVYMKISYAAGGIREEIATSTRRLDKAEERAGKHSDTMHEHGEELITLRLMHTETARLCASNASSVVEIKDKVNLLPIRVHEEIVRALASNKDLVRALKSRGKTGER